MPRVVCRLGRFVGEEDGRGCVRHDERRTRPLATWKDVSR